LSGLLVVTPPGPEADTLCSRLTARGYEVFSASNGAAAVDLAFRRRPDVILMDPALSAMDRWHAVKRLHTAANTSQIPVLTLASDSTTAAGLERVLGKIESTVGRPDLIVGRNPPQRVAVVEEPDPYAPATVVVDPSAMRQSSAFKPPRRPASAAARAPILVVDDNALNRDMLSRRLVRSGYDVEIAEDGEQALHLIAGKSFGLVLLDWMMPGLSGVEVLRRIRAERSPAELPVIMATAKSDAPDFVEALQAGANDCATKPLNYDVIIARIAAQLSLVEAHRKLKASEHRYRALLENTGDMIVQYRVDGEMLYVSPASRALLGYEPDALMQRSFFEWLHPIDRRELQQQQKRKPTLPPAFTFIARMQRKDANWTWVEVSARVLREGGAALVQAACRDVTEHMERLAGDEPPLPLGGDIVAHPGWRGAVDEEEVAQGNLGVLANPASRRVGDQPMVVVTVVGTVTGDVADTVADAVRRALAEEDDA